MEYGLALETSSSSFDEVEKGTEKVSKSRQADESCESSRWPYFLWRMEEGIEAALPRFDKLPRL